VQLLDLHPTTEQRNAEESTSPRLEILEAGTGHGGLTLHLARAIHAANAPHPPLFYGTDGSVGLPQDWRQSRRAIVHTIDIKEQYSKRARKTVLGFRRGLYYADVDFHVGDVSEFIENQFSKRSSSEPFLSAAILDMPSADRHLELVSKALRVDGKLVVFNPSVTQIGDCIKRIRKQNLPLSLDTVVELGVGMSAGREWDIRVAAVRARQAKGMGNSITGVNVAEKEDRSVTLNKSEEKNDEGYDSEQDNSPPDQPEEPVAANPEDEDSRSWAMVCRPKVGRTVIGGGFVGLWSKMRREE
jgi:tRNA A58 N-methylase Trm61